MVFNDIKEAWHIFKKDIKLEIRQKFEFMSMVLFSVSSILVFSISLGISPATTVSYSETEIRVISASLWVIFVFAGMLSFTSIFGREIKAGGGSLLALRSMPVKPQTLFFGKLLFNLGLLLSIQIIIVFIYLLFFQLDLNFSIVLLMVVLTIGTIDYACVGTLVSALAIYSRAKTLVVPILIFPLIIPSVILSVNLLTSILLSKIDEGFISNSLLLFFHFIITFMISLLTIETIIEE